MIAQMVFQSDWSRAQNQVVICAGEIKSAVFVQILRWNIKDHGVRILDFYGEQKIHLESIKCRGL